MSGAGTGRNTFRKEQKMRVNEFVRMAVLSVCCGVFLLLGASATVQADEVQPGIDLYMTVEGPGSYYDFLGDPIPSEFFGPGSDPFDGVICLTGVPIDPSYYDHTDTIVNRLNPSFFSGDPLTAEIDTEMIALDLVSTMPITVTFNGGNDPTDYDVSISLLPSPPSYGKMQLQRDNMYDDGGTILSLPDGDFAVDSFFDISFEIEFMPEGGGGGGAQLDRSDIIRLAMPVPWSHTPPDGTWIVGETSNFFPGATPDHPEIPPVSLQFDGWELHLELLLVPEPATLSLMVLGGLALLRRRRK